MSILQQNAPVSNTYQQRATDTRNRRQAAGRYATPAQKAALRRYLAGGLKALLPGDDELIATHPQMRGFSVNWRDAR